MTGPEVEATLLGVQEEMLGAARRAMTARPTTPAPLAVVVAAERVIAITLLDLSQRLSVMQRALDEYEGLGFVLLHDGYIVEEGERRDALLLIRMSPHAASAVALPYVVTDDGCTFDPPVEVADVPAEYHTLVFKGAINGAA